MAYTSETIQKIYIAFYQRPADAAGLAYWLNVANTNGLETVLANFATSAEATALYGTLDANTDRATVEGVINAIYQAAFGRAAEADGLAYWADQFMAGAFPMGNIAYYIIDAASANDLPVVTNKVAAAELFTTATTTGVTYDTNDLATVRTWLDGITTTATTEAAVDTFVETSVANVGDAVLAGTSYTLLTTTDTFIGTAKNDTITATSSTLATADTIIDQSTTDHDVMNLTLTTAMLAGTHDAKVSGIENINVNWNAFGTATIEAGNFVGSTITGTSTKTGFLGHMTVNNAGDNNIVAGAGMVGTLTVKGITDATVDATYSKTVVANSAASATADDALVLNAGASVTSVTAAGFQTMTVDAGTATTIALTDTDAAALTALDTATLIFGANAALANKVDVLTVEASVAGKTLTVTNTAATVKSIDVAGANAMTIKVADTSAAGYTGLIITNSGTGNFTYESGSTEGAADISKIAADSFVFTGTIGGAVTLKSGDIVTLEANGGAATAFTIAGTATTDILTLNLSTNQTAIATTGVETLTVNVDADEVDNAADVTLIALNVGTKKAILATANDVTIGTLTAGTLDATATTNDLTVSETAVAATTVYGGSADNVVNFKGVAVDSNYVGQDGKDTIDFVNAAGNATAILGNGVNTVTANSVTTGSLVVIGGTGVDTVTCTSNGNGTGEINLDLGAGNDVMSVTVAAGNDTITIDAGAGNDKLTLAGASTANDVFTLTFGDGTDTLVASTDLTAGTWAVTGLDIIDVTTNAGGAVLAASVLTGQSYEIKASGTNGDMGYGVTGFKDHLKVEIDTAGSYNFSSIVLNSTLTDGVSGLKITGVADNDTIVGTSGNDIIDAVNGTNTVTGGLGMDVMTAGTGVDTFVIGTADCTATAFDVIIGLATAADFIKTGTAGSATNYLEADLDTATNTGTVSAHVAAAVAAANGGLLDGTIQYIFFYNTDATAGNTTNGYLVIDNDLDGTADQAIVLTGNDTAADFAYTNIIA